MKDTVCKGGENTHQFLKLSFVKVMTKQLA